MIDTNHFNVSKNPVRTCIVEKVRCGYEFIGYEISCIYFPIVWFLFVYYVINVFFQMSLILSGDIETNPGPITTKTCPCCDAQLHIRKKNCICGYAFNQNYQNLKTINPFPICASPSTLLKFECCGNTPKYQEIIRVL